MYIQLSRNIKKINILICKTRKFTQFGDVKIIIISEYSGKNLCSVKKFILDNNDSDILQ
jgi:hypothetical protein